MNVLIVLGLLAVLATPTFAGGNWKCRLEEIKSNGGRIDPEKEMCAYLPFKGTVGSIISASKPSLIAQLANDHASYIFSGMKKLVSLIPGVGSYLTMAYDISAKLFSEPKETLADRLVREIRQEIDALKKYVDAKIQQAEYLRLTQHLTGLLAGGKACSDYDKPDQIVDLERCLISLNTRVIGFVKRFMPTDDSMLAYTWSLPLFRQYGDLQLTITQDMLRIAMRLKKNSAAEDYARRLRDQSKQFYKYAKDIVIKNIKRHTTFKAPKCQIKKSFQHSVHQIVYGICTQELYNGRICTEEAKVGLPVHHTSNQPYFDEAYFLSHTCHKAQVSSIKKSLFNDLKKYWSLEIMNTASSWYKVGKEADKLYNKLKT